MIEGLSKGLLRCGYCHGEAHGLLEGCAECGILLHADCRRALGRCPTLGCKTPSVQPVPLVLQPAEPAGLEPVPSEPVSSAPESSVAAGPSRWSRLRGAGFTGLLLSVHRALLPVAVVAACLMGAYTVLDALKHTLETTEETPTGASPEVVLGACRRFRTTTGRWPESLDELFVSTGEGWKGPYLPSWPASPEGEDYVLIYRGRQAWLGTGSAGPSSGTIELERRLFVKAVPVAACGLPPQSAHVRAHQLSQGR